MELADVEEGGVDDEPDNGFGRLMERFGSPARRSQQKHEILFRRADVTSDLCFRILHCGLI